MNDAPKIPGGSNLTLGIGSFDDGGYIDGGGFGGTNPLDPDFGWDLPPLEPPKPPPLPPPSTGDGVDPAPPSNPPQVKDPGPPAPQPQPPPPTTSSTGPTKEEKDAAAAYWTQDVLTNGTDGFMDALVNGDPQAKLALQNPEFLTILQAKMHEEQQLLSTITNLLNNKNSVALGIIGNLRG